MDPLTSGFYAIVCGSLAAFAPQGSARWVRAGMSCWRSRRKCMAAAAWVALKMTQSAQRQVMANFGPYGSEPKFSTPWCPAVVDYPSLNGQILQRRRSGSISRP